MEQELVTFKGINEGVFINIKGHDMEAIKEEIKKKMETSLPFYKGTNIIDIRGENISSDDILEIRNILKYKYDLSILKEDKVLEEKDMEGVFQGIDCGTTKFINRTIRSGQVETYPGNIVIIGDVNPGGLIEAKGNVIVLGSLKGVAHAGIGGNERAIVAAYNLEPTQLRIADIIVRPPDEESGAYKFPEIAKVKDGKVIIEPYLPNKQ